jgi:hypothetical protein
MEKDKQDRKAHEEVVTAREKEEEARQDASPHKPRKRPGKGKTRMVTDPTTGREIEVEDQDSDSMDVVKNPKVFIALHPVFPCMKIVPIAKPGYSW